MSEPTRLWGGRFASGPSNAMSALSLSVHFDWRLAPYDIAQTRAHAGVLHAAGLLRDDELDEVRIALDALMADVASGAFTPSDADEDVHTAIERGLLERLGPLGGKLRAGRSRNDQVSTDFRLYLRDHVRRIADEVVALQRALFNQATTHVDVAAPGFTHLQHAQPVSLGHELAKHVHALGRDLERLEDWDRRAARSPMGAGALAGSSLGLDPKVVAAELGFDEALANSIDAVSDRDWVAEFLFVAAQLGVHLSRLGEEVILWTSREFGWATLDDAWSTGSSIMPQKKNPDVPELARGKTGRVVGHLMGLITLMKGQPLAYNKDNQEDKEPLFDTVDTLKDTLRIFSEMIGGQINAQTGQKEGGITVNAEAMEAATKKGYATATDLADYLVKKGLPFRDAHEVVAHAVKTAQTQNLDLSELPLSTLQQFNPAIQADVFECLSLVGSLNARKTLGGTAPDQVRQQIARHHARLNF